MDLAKTDETVLENLYDLLAEWRNLTLAESVEIQASHWKALEELQSKKASLQQSIEELERAFSRSQRIPEDKKTAERKRLKHIAAELFALEKKNETMLGDRIAEADSQLKKSNKAIQSLRHVQQAYGSGIRSFWQAYS